MNPEGPYVSVAAICEKVLSEKDGLVSCIRFVDILNLNIHKEKPEEPTGVRFAVNAFIAFKSGSFVGTKQCVLRLVTPSGKTGKLSAGAPKGYPVIFKGEGQGYNLILTIEIPASENGLYWFDVMLDDEVYTRIPLRINITWQSSPSPADSENSQQTVDQA